MVFSNNQQWQISDKIWNGILSHRFDSIRCKLRITRERERKQPFNWCTYQFSADQTFIALNVHCINHNRFTFSTLYTYIKCSLHRIHFEKVNCIELKEFSHYTQHIDSNIHTHTHTLLSTLSSLLTDFRFDRAYSLRSFKNVIFMLYKPCRIFSFIHLVFI